VKGVIWDLCSGLGGWTEAFVEAGWRVIRIENNPELKHIPHTFCLDVLDWREWVDAFPDPDIIVASPPCLEFSLAFNAPKPKAIREGRDFEPSMDILEAVMEVVDAKKPSWWIVENVYGASKVFTSFLNREPNQIIPPFMLWGNFPPLPLLGNKMKKPKNKNLMNGAQNRALIPFELSFELLQTWREQTTLQEWF